MEHLADAELADYVEGRVDQPRRLVIRQHLEACERCRERVHERAVVFFHETTLAGAPATSSASALGRGSSVGRYVLLGVVGAGGMGVVYAGYDPELDRKVAIKLLRAELRAGSSGRLRDQMLHEAQAMARLNHPSVVHVYDVGVVGDQVFVAMEFVEGSTLRAWLSRPRPWREVLPVFHQAGLGLAAAHHAGLVHRDFKPDNVLVDDKGRVLVTDFGLASATGTREGTVVGTPAYMAPEQMTGEPADARTDVFCFCAALYEALYRVRAFHGTTLTELKEAVMRGQLSPPPADAHVPSWVRRVIVRGLEADPSLRWPSMDALLGALELRNDPRRRAFNVALVASTLLVLAGGGAVLTRAAARNRQLCTLPADALDGVWDAARRRAIESQLGDRARSIEASLDRRVDEWRAMWTQACQATRVRGEQSAELLDLRMQCLDDRKRELRAVTDELSRADGAHASSLLDALTPLDGCADRRALAMKERPPRDAGQRQRIAAAREQVTRARALYLGGGKLDEAETLLHTLDGEAVALGYQGLIAQVRYLEGMLQAEQGHFARAEQLLENAAAFAERGADDEIAAWAFTGLIEVTGGKLHRPDEGKMWSELAAGAIARLGGNERLERDRLAHLGLMLSSSGAPEAVPTLEQALTLTRKLYGDGAVETARVMANLANELAQRGELTRSAQLHEQAWKIFAAALGPEAIDTLKAVTNYGYELFLLGRSAEAVTLLEPNVASLSRRFGEQYPSTATARINLGDALEALGRHDQARAESQRAIDVFTKLVGESHPVLVEPLTTIGLSQAAQGDAATARATLERALRIGTGAKMPERDLARTRQALAKLH